MPEFSNFQELSLHRQEGHDFQIRKKRRGSRVAVVAPHGGTIEPVTSKLAEATAGASFSWYCFEGLKGNRGNLHITSSHFNEPQCLKLIGPPATTANTKFPGRDRSNICSRGRQGMGVQLEILRSLRDRLDTNEILFNHIAEALDRAINRVLNGN